MQNTQSQHPFNVADYLLTRLKQLNLTDVFQIPGDYVKHFTQTLEYFDGIATIGTSNELDAAYAADAYARTRGIGAVSLQYGVSTFSALNAIAGAYVERSPVVVISATPGSQDRQIGDMYNVLYHHSTGDLNADQEILEKVTCASLTLSTNVGAAEKIDELLIDALTHQRPVYIACYTEVWGEPCKCPPDTSLKPRKIESEPAALVNALDQAWAQITAAENPLILAGVELLRHDLTAELEELIEESGILYTTTSLAKSVIDEKGNKFIGTYSDQASIPNVIETVENSDCVITLGAIITDDYLWFAENKFAQMIISTTDQMRCSYRTFQGVTTKDFIKGLIKRFKESQQYPLATRAPEQPVFPEPWISNSDPKFEKEAETITFNRFHEHMFNFIQENELFDKLRLTYGVSCSMYVATNAYGLKQGSFISSAVWQCVGFGTGAVLGAQLGSKQRAWGIVGDGDFMMICQSLSTIARNKLNSVIFVMNNGVYAIEQVFVDVTSFEAGPSHKFDEFDILAKWDYAGIANGYGANYLEANTMDELHDIFHKLQEMTDKPCLVNVTLPSKTLPDQMKRIADLG